MRPCDLAALGERINVPGLCSIDTPARPTEIQASDLSGGIQYRVCGVCRREIVFADVAISGHDMLRELNEAHRNTTGQWESGQFYTL